MLVAFLCVNRVENLQNPIDSDVFFAMAIIWLWISPEGAFKLRFFYDCVGDSVDSYDFLLMSEKETQMLLQNEYYSYISIQNITIAEVIIRSISGVNGP